MAATERIIDPSSVGDRLARHGADVFGRAAVAALDYLQVGLIVADHAGRAVDVTARAASILGADDGISLDGGSIAIADQLAADALTRVLDANAAGTLPDSGVSISIPRRSRRRPYDLRIAAIDAGRAALILRDLDDQAASAAFAHGFGLTPAEARVALALADGRSVDEIARDFEISRFTVRAQLRQIFVKTDTHRQAELVKLVLSSTRPAP